MSSTNSIPMMVPRANGAFEFPRRNCIDQFIPAEKMLYEAIGAIDALPGNTTEIVMKLQQAREELSDWVERNGFVLPS